MKKLLILFVILITNEVVSQTPAITRDALYYSTQQIDDPNTSADSFGDLFGSAIKVFGNTMIITARLANKVYVYNRVNGSWTLSQTITPSISVNNFGISVDVSYNENLMVVRSLSYVFIFEKNGSIWQETYASIVLGGCNFVGNSVAISEPFPNLTGRRIAVGACNYNNNRGAVSILVPESGGWVEDIDNVFINAGQPGESFGASLAWSGQTLFASRRGVNNNTGVVMQLFVQINEQGIELPAISAPNLQPGDEFGYNLIANDNELIIASKGKIFVYLKEFGPFGFDQWPTTPNQELIPQTNELSNIFGQRLSFTSSGFAASSFNNVFSLSSIYVYASAANSNYDLKDIIASFSFPPAATVGTKPINPGLDAPILDNSFGADGDIINAQVVHNEAGYWKHAVLKFNRAQTISQTDVNNLSSIYNATDGDNWINNTNWSSNLQPRKWFGVGTNVINGAEEITEISLVNNNLVGEIPVSFNNLSSISSLFVFGNALFGNVPDFSGNANIGVVSIYGNNYQFEDINVVLSDYQQAIQNEFFYNPQFTTDPPQDIVLGVGSDITLSVAQYETEAESLNSSQNNQFQWFKDGSQIAGANGPIYNIVNAQTSDNGVYTCEVTNPLLPTLIIERAPISVFVDPNLNISNNNVLELKIYPNPAKSWININLGQSFDNSTLIVYDLNGRLVSKQKASGDTYILNIEDLNSGTYIIRLFNNDRTLEQRFIKE